MSFPPFISALKLNVSVGTSSNAQTFEQPIHPSELSGTTNSVLITENEIVTAFDNEPLGTIFSPSIVTTYEGFPSGNILPTPSVSKFVPRQITPTLSIASISNKLTTDDPFSLSVTSPSDGLKIYSSSDPDVASVDLLGQVTPVSGGTTSILFFQAASDDGVYTAAGPVSTQLIVNKAVPALSIASISNKLTTDDSFYVSVTGPSDGVKTYSSSHPQVASVHSSSGLVTPVSGGTTTITVSQAASDDGVYTAAGPVSTQLVVDKAVPALSIASISNKLATADPFPVSVTGPSNGLKTYLTSHPQVATIDSFGLITLVSGGTTTITVSQAASDDGVYAAAGPVSTQLVVVKAVPVLSIASIHDKHTTNDPFSVSVTSPSNGLKTYSSSHPQVATIDSSSGLVTLVSGGTTTIFVSQAASDDGVYTATGPVSVELDVDKVVPVLSIESIDDKFTTDDPFYLSVTSPSDGLKIYSSSDPDVASVDLLGQVTPVSGGTTSILFFQAASDDGVYTAAGPVSTQLVVNKAVPVLSIASISNKLTTDASFSVSVTGPSDGVKTYSSSENGVATIDSLGIVTLVSGGTTTITVSQEASDDGVYTAAGPVSTQLVVVKAVPALSISSISNKLTTDNPFSVSVTGPSNGLKTYLSSHPQVASVHSSSGLVTLVSGGTTTITVSQEASDDGVYTAAGAVSTQLVVNKAVPVLSIASINDKLTTDDPFSVSVTSPSNGLKTYLSSHPQVASVHPSSGLITLVSGGTTTITVSQAASNDGVYTAAGPVSTQLVVDKAVPVLSIASIHDKHTTNDPFSVSVTSPSNGVKTYSSSNPEFASVHSSSGLITPISVGTTTITVSQAASDDGKYAAAGPVSTQLDVDKAVPTLSIASISNKLTTDDPFSVVVTSPSNGLKIYSSSDPDVASVDLLGQVTLVSGGTTTILFFQAASYDGKYAAAGPVSTQLVVDKAVPALSIASISNKLTTDASFSVSVTGPSNGIKTYSSSHPQVATIDSFGLINLVSGGTTTITISQGASNDGVYAAAGPVSTQLVVNKAVPNLSISSIDNKIITDDPFYVSVTSPSNGLKTYSSSHPQFASIDSSSGLITLVGSGTTTITVSQAASNDGVYAAAGPVSTQLVVDKAVPALSIASIDSITTDLTSLPLSVTTNSDGLLIYSSSDPDVASVDELGQVTPINSGTTQIIVSQLASPTGVYVAATPVTIQLVVDKITPTLGNFREITKTFGDMSFTISAPTSNSTGSFSYTSSNESVATILGTTVTIVGGGSSTITATQSAINNYSSTTITASLVVHPNVPTIHDFIIPVKTISDLPFTLSAPHSNSTGSFSYTSSDESVATISGNTVTIVRGGSSTITATQAATNNYISAAITASLFIQMPWVSTSVLDIDGEAANDQSGYSVSLSSDGNTLAIGAPFNYHDESRTGHVRIYNWNAASLSWTQRGSDINGEFPEDKSGFSVSLSSDGNTVAIGSPYAYRELGKLGMTGTGDDDSSGPDVGHVMVYYWNTLTTPNQWTKRGNDIYGEALNDLSGYSVSLSSNGNTVAIGAPFNDGAGADAGHVRVYYWNTAITPNRWTQRGSDINGEAANDQSGWSVSLSSDGNTVAIGAPYNNGAGEDAGHVRVYDWNTLTIPNQWTKRGSDIDGEAAGDKSGYSVSLSSDGNTVAIGAPNNIGTDLYAGQVRVYDWNTASVSWNQRGSDIDGEAASNHSGYSVSLSSDGNTVAVGAPFNSGAGLFAGHTRVYKWDGSLWRQFGLDIDGEAAGDRSGQSVSLSSDGNRVAIGAPFNDGTNYNTGHVRVYRIAKIKPALSNFTVPAKNFGNPPFTLSPPTTNVDGSFFYISSNTSVATISGSTVTIVGSGYSTITAVQSATDNYDYSSITATLFVSSAWFQTGSDIHGKAGGDNSGYSVSLSSDGNILAIGAPYNDGTGSDAGHVRVYNLSGSSWVQRGSDIDGEAAGDLSGWSVSLSSDGNMVAIGSPNNDGAGSNAGQVRVYNWGGSSWIQRGTDIDGEAANDQSGWSVSLSSNGNTVAIGAPYNDGSRPNVGHVRVYDWNTAITPNRWTKRGSDIDGEALNDLSGYSVSLSSNGNTVAIGAPYNDGTGLDAGHVRIYYWNTAITPNKWSQRGQDIDGEAAGDHFGRSVSLSSDGNTVAIGAPYNDGAGADAGHVRVYYWNTAITPNTWTQRGSDIDGEAAGDLSGWSVSLSSDGNKVAIGAPQNNSAGSDVGHARIYNWNGSSWTKRISDIDGEASDDQSGYSVCLSSDGNMVAIGAPQNNGIGSDAGHVRVYTFLKQTPTLTNFTMLRIPSISFGDPPFMISAPTTDSYGSFSYISSDTSIATISGNMVSIVGAGSCNITATQSATENHTSATITTFLNINIGATILSEYNPKEFLIDMHEIDETTIEIKPPRSTGDGSFSYTVQGVGRLHPEGKHVIVKVGTTEVTVMQASTKNSSSAGPVKIKFHGAGNGSAAFRNWMYPMCSIQ